MRRSGTSLAAALVAGLLESQLGALTAAALPHGDEHHHAGTTSDPSDLQEAPLAGSYGSHAAAMDMHSHHGTPKLELNETEVIRQHGVTPLSWYGLDSGEGGELYEQYGSHSGTMWAHSVFMTLAFFVFLPLVIYLRSAKHNFLAGIAQSGFLLCLLLGVLTGMGYSAATPDMYPGQAHGRIGWVLTALALALSSAQILRAGVILFAKRAGERVSLGQRIRHLLGPAAAGNEYAMVDAPDARVAYAAADAADHEHEHEHDYEDDSHARTLYNVREESEEDLRQDSGPARPSHEIPHGSWQNVPLAGQTDSAGSRHNVDAPAWRKGHRQELSVDIPRLTRWHSGSSSGDDGQQRAPGSDETLHEDGSGENHRTLSPPLKHGPQSYPPRSPDGLPHAGPSGPGERRTRVQGLLKYSEIFLWRVMVLVAWVALLSGITVYTGGCRASYWNSCLAHTIKGSIFFWYGVISFGRYCGAWAELGWAWNRKPPAPTGAGGRARGSWRAHFPSAEMVECAVIWLYGATNTWMERFGAHAGDPWTVKQVQHVSIAVMYFFAGGAGMMLESRTVRAWVSHAVLDRVGAERAAQPSSYGGSFNIFPAICIGVTGVAMAAHHQDYVFAVTIHALWGTLLAGFAVFRVLTYTFLHLRPPASILPSRPPTEALASFCLCAGGLVFILSTEEVVFWAMRHGADDMMAFLNVTVAFVCFVFAWILALAAVKGWATKRARPASALALPPSAASARKYSADV